MKFCARLRHMRSIGRLDTRDQALGFVDALLAKGIRGQADPSRDGAWEVWIHDDDLLARAEALLQEYRANPDAFRAARSQAEAVREQDAGEQAAWRERMMDRDRIFPQRRSYRPGPLTMLLVAGCAFVYFKTLGGEGRLREALFLSAEPGGLAEIRSGEIWRLWTPMLLHFGMLHIVFNMMWLLDLGSQIETRLGSVAFVLRVLVIELVSNVAQYLVAGPYFGGMSGVVFGLIGYIWIRGRRDPSCGLFLSRGEWIMSLIWFGLCFTGALGPIANGGHAGGLVVGLLWGWWDSRRK